MGLNCVETNHCEDNFTYSLSSGESRRIHIVRFNWAELSICCDCKLFETLGLLCCHALRVFLVNNVNNIPDNIYQVDGQKMPRKGCVALLIHLNQMRN